jgi:hypothetical protein
MLSQPLSKAAWWAWSDQLEGGGGALLSVNETVGLSSSWCTIWLVKPRKRPGRSGLAVGAVVDPADDEAVAPVSGTDTAVVAVMARAMAGRGTPVAVADEDETAVVVV